MPGLNKGRVEGPARKRLKGRGMRRSWIRAVLLLAGAALIMTFTASTVTAKTPGGKLSKEEKALLDKAKEKGDKTVTLLVAAQLGQTKTVVDGLEALGATIRYRDDALGYVRADVPTDKVKEAFALSGVLASDIDALIPLPDPRPDGVSAVLAQPRAGCGDAAPERVHADPGHGCGPVRRRASRPGTAAASRSASSTPASRSTIRASRPPALARRRSSTGSPARIR